ncbi:TonB-dependent receptor [Steroidobacter sp.]|uniref:TonB-dependent receptor n=1 Tax=Steroidobacter sp. TaxID=1978227 RepID=UPI001A510C18|nr:TonB-dependent receptor [Steroidobacter sp.]MBL8269406.1 TonB-dependent receptor [Steroidobacter sp.]
MRLSNRRGRFAARISQAVALAATATVSVANAQETVVEEIVVTATKRETTMKDTPAAIGAISGDAIRESQAFSLESFARLDPSVQVNNRGVGDNQIIVRGIASSGKPTVGLYFDEAVITGLGLDGGSDNQPNIQLHDMERIEILKGPQGTLFGAGSMSGTVRFITNTPDLEKQSFSFSGAAASVKDGNPFYQGEAVANLPIIDDKLGMRAVVWGDSGGGYIDQNRNGTQHDDVNDQSVWGTRLTLASQITEQFKVTVMGLYQESDADGSQYFEFSEGPYRNISPTQEPFEDEIKLFSAIADYDAGFGTFTGTVSYMDRDLNFSRDSTPTANRFNLGVDLAYHQAQEISNLSSEFRFASTFDGPLQFVTGAFYAEQKSTARNAALVADSATGLARCNFHADCVASGFARDDINSSTGEVTIDQFAIFSETEYKFTDKFTGTLGVRYYTADIGQQTITTQSLRHPVFSPVQTADVLSLDEDTSENEMSYNFALAYALTNDTTLYSRVASGFRPGGANDSDAAAQQGVIAPAKYESDTLWSFEVGAKSYFANRMFYTEVSVYRINWSDQQISVTDPGGTFVYIANAGKSYVNGVEFQLNGQPTDALSFNIGATYTDSRLSEDLPSTAQTSGFDGDRIPYTPKWSFAGQVTYEVPFSSSLTGYASTNFNYRGVSYTNFNSQSDDYQELDSYLLVGVRAGVRVDGWDAGIFVDNVTDETPEIGLRVTGDGYRVYTTRPLTAGVRVSKSF